MWTYSSGTGADKMIKISATYSNVSRAPGYKQAPLEDKKEDFDRILCVQLHGRQLMLHAGEPTALKWSSKP